MAHLNDMIVPSNEFKYSRMDQVKFVEGSLLQNLKGYSLLMQSISLHDWNNFQPVLYSALSIRETTHSQAIGNIETAQIKQQRDCNIHRSYL